MNRAAANRAIERSALERLVSHLGHAGHRVEIEPDRPDEIDRSRPAVDFVLKVDGDQIGVEITQLIPAARSHYEIAALQTRLKSELEGDVERRRLGVVAVELDFGPLPSSGHLRRGIPKLREAIRDVLKGLRADPVGSVTVPIASEIDFIVGGLIHQFPGDANVVGFITSSGEWGGILNPQADQFVDELLSGNKPIQTATWRRAWIVIVDRIGLVGADLIGRSLRNRQVLIPANWERIYFLPAPDGEEIEDLLAEWDR